MSLGEQLIDALRSGASGEVSSEADGMRVKAEVVGSGPYGSDLRALEVERTAPLGDTRKAGRLSEAVEAIGDRLTYLPEKLEVLESDGGSGRAVLRTRRKQVQGREYYEVQVDGGDRVDVRRYRGRSESGGRDAVVENFGHGVLRRLVDDLGEILSD
ncbi:MAG TPA: hypothetical protein DIU15_04815 [Deltaproteobacteria bacterium]|nr:hypothetical protein [Deltaproteobacteria bacterium]HCP45337.1 hypothetical protein [Deltaproteobacteria bacterium]